MIAMLLSALLAAGEPMTVVELPAAEEVEMALTAAPDHLRAQAGVWRLAGDGYVQTRPSANGFNCLVSRDQNRGLAPVCYDREGSGTLLHADIARGRLLRQGRSEAEIDAEIDRQYADGRLIAPRRGGVAYMLSPHFTQDAQGGGREQIYPPHLMFYAPYMTDADIGSADAWRYSTSRPWVLNPGKPNAYVIVALHDAH